MMRSSKGVSKAMYLIMRTLWRTSFIRLTRLSRAPICERSWSALGNGKKRRRDLRACPVRWQRPLTCSG